MSEFRKYANKLLKETNLNSSERNDLEKELIEHLNSMKDDYIKEGISEKDSITMSINNLKDSDFLKEINNFTLDRKFSGINMHYILKISTILITLYIVLMSLSSILFTTNPNSNILYFLIISFVLFFNYKYTCSYFESQKDIFFNISIICFIFFLIEKVLILISSLIYNILADNSALKIFDLYIFDFKKIIIYISISIFILLLVKFEEYNSFKRNLKLPIINMFILINSLLIILYFLYPNRFYILNLVIYKIFGIDVQFFDKNLLYMNINNKFIIINIGLVFLILFIIYKFILQIFKINRKSNKNPS